MTKYYVQIEVPASQTGNEGKSVSLTIAGGAAITGTVTSAMSMTDLVVGGSKPLVVDSVSIVAHTVV